MKVLHFKNLFTILFVCLSLFGFAQKQNAGNSKKPNIIFILTDDQRWDALGYAGNKIIQTPEMDKLAKEGVYFKNAVVTTPICAASRASIFSGLHERAHKFNFQTGNILDRIMETSYPNVLKEAGYFTGFYGKFGVKFDGIPDLFDMVEDYDRNNSFKDYRGYYYKKLGKDTVHLTRYTGERALEFLDKAPADKPFSLSLCFSAPHAHDGAEKQYFWQEEPGRLYNDVSMPGPRLADDKYFEQLPSSVKEGFNRLRWTWRYDTPEKYQHSVKGYYRMLKGIDLEIEKIRKKLENKGLADNTVIILMGDNGYFMGERQLAGKWLMYDNSVRVPLIVYDPRVKEHKDIDDMALNIDVTSTLADLAGAKLPAQWQGKSLMPIVNGTTKTMNRDTILIEHIWEFENIPPSEGVRTAEWKYLRYVNDKSIEELYYLAKDPDEINNLVGKKKYKEKLDEFRNKCNELVHRFDDKYSGIPINLKVESIRKPEQTTIVDNKPEFSWSLPEGTEQQLAYQILISSSKDLASKNIGDVWNSARVVSNKNTEIELGGKPLAPNTSYFWRVRIFDNANRLSEYSEIQEFKTGSFGEKITAPGIPLLERIAPSAFTKNENGYFIDFGKDAFATIELKYKATKKETITLRLGERLANGKIDNNIGKSTIRFQEVKVELSPDKDTYIVELVPDKRNTKSIAVTMPAHLPIIMPFRYVEIDGNINLKAENITQLAYFIDFDNSASAFNSSNNVLDQIWDLCKYSIKATSFSGYYVDGDRERIPYEADAYINQLSHYAVDSEYGMARRTIEYFMEKPTWPTEWQLHVAMLFYQDYMYTGNTELIEKYYEPLKHKTLMALENEDGLISTQTPLHDGKLMAQLGFADTTKRMKDIVDWPHKSNLAPNGEIDGFEFMPINTVINSFYYHNMVIMTEFAKVLGKSNDALDFSLRAAKTKKAINEKLFNAESGNYRDGIGTDHASLHANMLPLAFNIVPCQYKENVAKHVKSRGMACSVYGSQYLLEGLFNAKFADYAIELMTAKHDRSWYNMIKIGSTITLEAWDEKYKNNLDWNHAWGAAPANIISRNLWGIQPKTPGYSIATIKPQFGSLSKATITVPTIKGNIVASYTKRGAMFKEYIIEIPNNMVGELELDSDSGFVTVNGKAANMSFGTIRLTPGVNTIQIKKNSF